jgi:GNAT superfamily N-acetyltransferase
VDFQLRPSEPDDEAFLWRLNQLAYEEVVTAQFGPWDPVKQRALFDIKRSTQTYFIIVSGGVPVGAMTTARSEVALTLLELLVLPAQQNAGIGTRVLLQLQAEARRERLPLLLQVLLLNRARRLYERLGFRVYETTETHFRMRWDCDTGVGA